jgi:adenylate cyclase
VPSLPARVAFDLGFPVPDQDDLILAWRGKAREFTRVSYSDLYEDFNRLKRMRPRNEFTGKIVIVGAAATGLQDLRVTPIDTLHPGAEILGTAIENLKNGRRMRYASPAWAAALGALLIGGLFLAFRRKLDVRLTGAALAAASAAVLVSSYSAAGRLLLFPALTPLAAAWTF